MKAALKYVKICPNHIARQTKKGVKRYSYYTITVPPDIAAEFPEGTLFAVQLTEGGILFRAVERKGGGANGKTQD